MKVYTNPQSGMGLFSVKESCFAISYVTGNCQIWSLQNVNNILKDPKECKQLIKLAHEEVGKMRQVLMDVNQSNEVSVERMFPVDDVVFKQRYLSTNGSNMTIYLIRCDSIKNW